MRAVVATACLVLGLFVGVWFFNSGSFFISDSVRNFLGGCDVTGVLCRSLPREIDGIFSVLFGALVAAISALLLQFLRGLRKN